MKLASEVLLLTGVVCYLTISCTDAVAPRSRSRFQSRYDASVARARDQARRDWLARARTGVAGAGTGVAGEDRFRDRALGSRTRTLHKFRPSLTRCCKIGEKTAKKEMSCNMDEHAMQRQGNVVHKAKLAMFTRSPESSQPVNRAAKVLISRIVSCAASKFSANLEKCCRYREAYLRELEACSTDLQGQERKKCRRAVRRRYP